MFTTAMRSKWELIYVDLFAGPGKCIVGDSEREIDGSPLIALKCRYKFDRYIFVEQGDEEIEALKKREKSLGLGVECKYYNDDCNNAIADIRKELSPKTLSLVFIDPTGLQVTWDSIKKLTEGLRMDILLNFMYGLGLKRNIEQCMPVKNSTIDKFLPPTIDWRALFLGYNKYPRGIKRTGSAILKDYTRELTGIGYLPVNVARDALRVRNSKNVIMYLLLFFSKHELGMKFWRNNIAKKYMQGELGLYE